jgi:ubiquitin carboxyl-terminal hydrolase 7
MPPQGIKNRGTTDDLNCLLQLLFHLPLFRSSLFLIPTTTHTLHTRIPLTLQRLFYQLQVGNESGETKELTNSFGWKDSECYTTRNLDELENIFFEALENSMKGTPADGMFSFYPFSPSTLSPSLRPHLFPHSSHHPPLFLLPLLI